MKNKTLAKILSILCFTTSILSCQNDSSDDASADIIEVNENIIEVNIENGIADWQEFLLTAGADFKNTIDNKDNINGFKGYARYSEILSFFASDYFKEKETTKRYITNNLKIFFDTYKKNEEDTSTDITPSTLNNIYEKFTAVHITSENKSNGSFDYIRISSGENNEVFDINKFYERLSKKEFSINGIRSQNPEYKIIVGIDDAYLEDNIDTDIEKLRYLLNDNIFKNAFIDKVKLSGNISGVESLYEKELEYGKKISFTNDAYSAPKNEDYDTLSLDDLSGRQARGFKMIISNTYITGKTESPLDFSNANLENVKFTNTTDLTEIPFNNVKSEGFLIFEGILPSEMKFLNAKDVILNNAVLPADGTNITSLKTDSFKVEGTLLNEGMFTFDENSSKGEITNFKGNIGLYDLLSQGIIIKSKRPSIEIVKLFLLNNTKQYI